jgi:hypothetical protein
MLGRAESTCAVALLAGVEARHPVANHHADRIAAHVPGSTKYIATSLFTIFAAQRPIHIPWVILHANRQSPQLDRTRCVMP